MADCSGAGGSIFNFNLEDFPYRANGRGWVVELHPKPPPTSGIELPKNQTLALFLKCRPFFFN